MFPLVVSSCGGFGNKNLLDCFPEILHGEGLGQKRASKPLLQFPKVGIPKTGGSENYPVG